MRLKLALPNHFYSNELEMVFIEEPFFGYAEAVLRHEGNRCWIEVSYNDADSEAVDKISEALMLEGYCVEFIDTG